MRKSRATFYTLRLVKEKSCHNCSHEFVCRKNHAMIDIMRDNGLWDGEHQKCRGARQAMSKYLSTTTDLQIVLGNMCKMFVPEAVPK